MLICSMYADINSIFPSSNHLILSRLCTLANGIQDAQSNIWSETVMLK